jgi:hypothetical protein
MGVRMNRIFLREDQNTELKTRVIRQYEQYKPHYKLGVNSGASER